jgi:hypothetical protein
MKAFIDLFQEINVTAVGFSPPDSEWLPEEQKNCIYGNLRLALAKARIRLTNE